MVDVRNRFGFEMILDVVEVSDSGVETTDGAVQTGTALRESLEGSSWESFRVSGSGLAVGLIKLMVETISFFGLETNLDVVASS